MATLSERVDVAYGSTFDLGIAGRCEYGRSRIRAREVDTPSGSLRVLSCAEAHQGFSYTDKVRRHGPGQLQIVGQYGITDKATRVVTFPSVPVGHVEIFASAGAQETVLALEFVAREETTVRNSRHILSMSRS